MISRRVFEKYMVQSAESHAVCGAFHIIFALARAATFKSSSFWASSHVSNQFVINRSES